MKWNEMKWFNIQKLKKTKCYLIQGIRLPFLFWSNSKNAMSIFF